MRFTAVLGLVALVAFSPAANAKKSKIPDIEKTGISEFDPTFMKAKAIHTDLDTIRKSLKASDSNLATTLSLPAETSLSDSLAELKKKAGNKVNTTLEDGRWPKLSASDAVPSDVSAGIEAVNALVDNLHTSATTLADMPEAAKAVGSAASAFRGQLDADLITRNNLTIDKLPKVAKKLKNNMKAVESTPARVEKVTKLTVDMTDQVLAAFPAGA